MKKIIALCVVLVLTVGIIAFPVFADFSFVENGVTLTADLAYIVEQISEFTRGNISSEELRANTATGCQRLGIDFSLMITDVGVNYSEILRAIGNKGIDIGEKWLDYFRNHGGSSVDNLGTPSFDLRGHGACAYWCNPDTGYMDSFYCDYIVVDYPSYSLYGNISYVYGYDGSDVSHPSAPYVIFFGGSHERTLYGDVRTATGEHYNNAVEITYTAPTVYEQDNDTLKDFLQDLINGLKLDYPDLSSIEGLLSAILAQCQSIDGKMCSSSEIQAMIDNAILQLQGMGEGSGGSVDFSLVIAALDNLKYENNNEQFIADLEQLIGLHGDYDEISKMELVEASFRRKTGFITDLRDICDIAVASYSNTSDTFSFDVSFNGQSYNMNFDVFAAYMPAFRLLLAVFIYISFAWRTYRKVPAYISGVGDDSA